MKAQFIRICKIYSTALCQELPIGISIKPLTWCARTKYSVRGSLFLVRFMIIMIYDSLNPIHIHWNNENRPASRILEIRFFMKDCEFYPFERLRNLYM